MAPSDFDPAVRGPEPLRGSDDELDVPLEDPVLMEEVELLSSVMIEAGAADQPLDDDAIDRLLGIDSVDG